MTTEQYFCTVTNECYQYDVLNTSLYHLLTFCGTHWTFLSVYSFQRLSG